MVVVVYCKEGEGGRVDAKGRYRRLLDKLFVFILFFECLCEGGATRVFVQEFLSKKKRLLVVGFVASYCRILYRYGRSVREIFLYQGDAQVMQQRLLTYQDGQSYNGKWQ